MRKGHVGLRTSVGMDQRVPLGVITVAACRSERGVLDTPAGLLPEQR